MQRHPIVAGHFYNGTPDGLKRQVEGYVVSAQKRDAFGILAPHAGLMYSGAVAGAVYSSTVLPDSFVLIGPNHTGHGAPVAIMCDGSWETPLGSVDIDPTLSRSILSRSHYIHEDSLAHLREHSLEVQLPFIQYFKKSFRIVPIQILDARLDTCLDVGKAVADAIAECGLRNAESQARNKSSTGSPQSAIHNVLIVASSDMSHYESTAAAKEKDFKAIERILDLDPEGLYKTVRTEGITMCGFGPAVAMLAACKLLGASKASLIKYANSGDVSGDYEQVVGYAGIVVS